jgi:hypothetical protein
MEEEKKFEEKIEEELEKKFDCKCNDDNKDRNNRFGSDSVYGLGIIGAAIFFISNATSFWAGVLGFLKALVWPAFMVYELFNFLLK